MLGSDLHRGQRRLLRHHAALRRGLRGAWPPRRHRRRERSHDRRDACSRWSSPRRRSATWCTRCSARRSSDDCERLAADPLLLGVRAAGREAAGHVHRAGVRRLDALARAGRARASTASAASIPTRTSTGRATRRRCCSSALASMLLTYVVLRLQHLLPLNPQALRGGARPAGVRDRGVVHDEHQLAVVRRRDDDVVLLADDAAGVPQLHVGRGRASRCAVALVRGIARQERRARSATSGSIWCAARSTCCCRSRSSLALIFVQQGVIQNFAHVPRGHHARGREAGARDGAGREPGSDQAARHQRRRLLQRQRGASVREPDAVDQLLVDVRDLHDPVGADVPVRPDGEEPEARLGGVGGDVRALLRAA